MSTLSSDSTNTEKKRKKDRNSKYCGVCGDLASSNHFGGLCCNSCKAFFRRSIENDNHLRFYCINKDRCVISVSNRRTCRYCRLNRCLAIGMSKEWFWTEDQRRMSVECEEIKRKQKDQYNTLPDIARRFAEKYGKPQSEILTSDFLTPQEMRQLEAIVCNYNQVHPNVDSICCSRDTGQSLSSNPPFLKIFRATVKRFYHYILPLPEFSSLPFQDQVNLLKHGILEMSILRLTLDFNPAVSAWSSGFHLDDFTRLTSSTASQMTVEFITSLQKLGVDELTIMLLSLIVLFTPDRSNLLRRKGIEKYQIYYALLLQRFSVWRNGRKGSKVMYGKFLIKLNDLRELSELGDLHHLRHEKDGILSIHTQILNSDQIASVSGQSSNENSILFDDSLSSIEDRKGVENIENIWIPFGLEREPKVAIVDTATFEVESPRIVEELICPDDSQDYGDISASLASPLSTKDDLFQVIEEFLENFS